MPDQINISFTVPNGTNNVLPAGGQWQLYSDFQVTVNGAAGSPEVRAVLIYRVPGGTQKIEGTMVPVASGGPNPPNYRFTFPMLPGNMKAHLAVIAETSGTGENHQSTILPVVSPPLAPPLPTPGP